MAAYPKLIQIAWDVIYQYILDWQREPYRWSQEIDIQTEIFKRIISIYHIIGEDTVIGNYKGAISGFEKDQKWNRVCCEPNIKYTYKDKKKYSCYPDIVIWEKPKNPNSPPDQKKGKNWPILWACEIKLDQKEESNWDIEKMRYLINQGTVKYGCWLHFKRKRADKGDGIIWNNLKRNSKLWSCEIKLPKHK